MLCHLHAGLFEIKGNIFKLTDQIKCWCGLFWKVHHDVIMHGSCAVELGMCAVY